MADIAQLIDELSIVNTKLYALCDRKSDVIKSPGSFTKEQLVELISNDIALCRKRSQIKNKINEVFGSTEAKEIKDY